MFKKLKIWGVLTLMFFACNDSEQVVQQPNQEKHSLQNALLRYCELDTLAMVMLWEGFYDLINN